MANKLVQLKDKNKNNIFSVPYFPIGYIYLSTSSINPSEIFGGVWEPIKDRFLLLAGDNYSAGDIGGESEHKLTIDEMPKHRHNISGNWAKDKGSGGWGAQINNYTGYIFETASINTYMSYSGSSKAHNNMPPYIVVYGWVKVSN